ncbi:MAG: hypothetical protein LUD76_05590 [Alistipes sp.]|nr:hypothetical protein [Alistipes sp.]
MKTTIRLAFLAISLVLIVGCSDKDELKPEVDPPQEDPEEEEEDPKIPSVETYEDFLSKYNNVEEYLLLDNYIYSVVALEDTNIDQIYSSMNHNGAKDPVTNSNWVYGFSSQLAKGENAVIFVHFDKRDMNQWRRNGTGTDFTHINFEYNSEYDQFIIGTNTWAYEMWWGRDSRVLIVQYDEVVAEANFGMSTSIRDGNWLLKNDYFK